MKNLGHPFYAGFRGFFVPFGSTLALFHRIIVELEGIFI